MSDIDNKRIARNTVYLYIRTLVSMIVSLYTSRKILEALGIEDFGIMSVVGGVISLMAFINGSMSVATQRYLTFELGRGSDSQYNKVFNIAVYVHAIMALIVLVVAETAGLWFVNTHLNIPVSRIEAANWIYQATILAALLGIIQTPYNASIVSYEHMHICAYVGLGETFARLMIVIALLYYPYDRLAVWGFALFAIQLTVSMYYRVYCIRKLNGCRLSLRMWDMTLLKSMMGFTGWNMFGTIAWTLKDQGGSVLLNIFGGPVYNAARGVSSQVTGAVRGLIGGFQTAVNPQLTKTYASGDTDVTCSLLCKSSKISFFLMLIVSVPVLFEIEYILGVWLVEVPPMAGLFTRLVILESLLDTLGGPMITSLMATGRIKWYQIVVGTILLLNIPVAYLMLKRGSHIATPLVVSVIFMILGNASRLIFCRKMIGLSLRRYIHDVILPISMVSVLALVPGLLILHSLEPGWLRLIIMTVLSFAVIVITVFSLGFNQSERDFIIGIIRPRIARILPQRT